MVDPKADGILDYYFIVISSNSSTKKVSCFCGINSAAIVINALYPPENNYR